MFTLYSFSESCSTRIILHAKISGTDTTKNDYDQELIARSENEAESVLGPNRLLFVNQAL